MYKIYLVEDDRGIAEAIKKQAEIWNFDVTIAEDFRNITDEFAALDPHLVILDISLPFYNGYYWCSEIRKRSQLPIIFISSASDSMNIVMAMNMGADEFVEKPFDQSVLIAKIQAMLRRSYDYAPARAILPEHRGAILNPDDQTLMYGSEKIELSKNEYRILFSLMENKGKVVSREMLMERLWESDCFVDENTLNVNVNRLRKKLDSYGLSNFITTKFKVGYIIE